MFKSFNLVWAKKESSYGVDPTPTYSSNGILTGPVDIEPTYRKLDRLNVKQYLGTRPVINIGETVKVSFETEVKGSGDGTAPFTAPEIGVLFEGCNMTLTTNKVTSSISQTFAASGDTITRGAGSYITDGFRVGDIITTNASTNVGPFTVTDVQALVLTVSNALSDETATCVVTANKHVYTPDDDIDGSSITLYVQQHDHKYVVSGARGTWSLEGKAGEYPKIKWEFTGLYADPTDNTMPTNTVYNSTTPPTVKSATFALSSFDTEAIVENFKLTYGNEIAKRSSVNASTGYLAHFVKDRKVMATIDPEATALSVFNPLAAMQANTEYTMQIVLGQSAGNRVGIYAPKVVFESAKYAEREGILTWDGSLSVCPSAGEDDVSVEFN